MRWAGVSALHGSYSLPNVYPLFALHTGMSKGKDKVNIVQIGRDLAQQMGYELVDAGVEKESAGQYLRYYLDSAHGISLNDCEAFHKRIQPLVEEVDYDFLEVSSPGIDRPIKTPGYALKAVGCPVEVKLYRPVAGQKAFTGIFKGLDDEGYHLYAGGADMVFSAKDVAVARRTIDVEEELAAADEAEQTQEEANEQ